AVLVARGLVAAGAEVELGGPERELAAVLGGGRRERVARGTGATLGVRDRGGEQRAVLAVLARRGECALRGGERGVAIGGGRTAEQDHVRVRAGMQRRLAEG